MTSSSNLLSNLTIVIPTYNRARYVLRNMHYWSGRGPTVVVLDGSCEPIHSSCISGLSNNIHYHHLPVSIFERLSTAAKLVQTKYTALLGDDELFIPSALGGCIAELDNNESFVSCTGRCLSFSIQQESVVAKPSYEEMEDYCILQNSSEARAVNHMSQYTSSIIYSVVRTPIWSRAMSIATDVGFPRNLGFEFFFQLSVSFLGKSKVLPVLSWLRSWENPGIPLMASKYPIHDWWRTYQANSSDADLLCSMALMLDSKCGSTEFAHHILEASIEAFVARPKNKVPVKNQIINKVEDMVPRKIKNFLQPYLAKRHKRLLGWLPILDAATRLEKSGVRFDKVELVKLERLIADFHSKPTNFVDVSR